MCLFVLCTFLELGYEAWLSPNNVICAFERIEPVFILAAVRVTDGYDYITQDIADEPFLRKLKLKSLGAVQSPVSRERTEWLNEQGIRVDSNAVDFSDNQTMNDLVAEASREDDPAAHEPTTQVSSVASAPDALFNEPPTEDHMFNDKAKRLSRLP